MLELRTAIIAASVLPLAASAQSVPCSHGEVEILAGVRDDFALPTDPTQQSPAFAGFLASHWPQPPSRFFDQAATDLALGQSFTGWGGNVCAATLEVRVRAGVSALTDNDSIRLGWTGSIIVADAFAYWTTFRSLNGGSWPPGSDRVFAFDLASLPPRQGFPTNILSELQDGELEIVVEDDSSVDYALLRVCPCVIGIEPEGWGRVKAGYR